MWIDNNVKEVQFAFQDSHFYYCHFVRPWELRWKIAMASFSFVIVQHRHVFKSSMKLICSIWCAFHEGANFLAVSRKKKGNKQK